MLPKSAAPGFVALLIWLCELINRVKPDNKLIGNDYDQPTLGDATFEG
jgi:hypothetical protein